MAGNMGKQLTSARIACTALLRAQHVLSCMIDCMTGEFACAMKATSSVNSLESLLGFRLKMAKQAL